MEELAVAHNNTVAEINETFDLVNPPWTVLGCKGCFKECEHFEVCKSILSDRVKLREELKKPLFQD